MKKCSNCFQEKPDSEFGRKKKGSPELKRHCKRCHADIVRYYARRARHPFKQATRAKDGVSE